MSVQWNEAETMGRIRQGAFAGVVIGIGIVEHNWVQMVTSGGRSGRVYQRRGVSHRASAPGEPPASDTGRLVNARRIEHDETQVAARMIVSTEYAELLELGTRKMEPRPSFRRAVAESRNDVTAAISAEVRKALA